MSPRPSLVRDVLPGRLTRLGLVLILFGSLLAGCRSGDRPARNLARDTTRGAVVGSSPGVARAGVNDYNRQREALGNLDSLVTPAQPAVPNH